MSAIEFSLDNTIGCLFLTAIFTTALWATSTVQVYFYYDRYSRNDTLRLKLHVMLVWLLDTAHQVATLRGLYMLFVKQFGNIFSIDHFDRNTFPLITILTAIVNAVVQALFIIRIWHLSKRSKLLTGIAIILVLAQFGITITYFAVIYPLSEATELSSVINIERAMSAATAFVDTAIGAVLVFLLHTNRSGFKRTDSVINHLIFYTVASGLLTGVDAILALIVSLALPKTLFYFLFDGIGPKLYVNSMLSMLNSRQKIRAELDSETAAGASDLRTSVLRARCADASDDVLKKMPPVLTSVSDIEDGLGTDRALVFSRNENCTR